MGVFDKYKIKEEEEEPFSFLNKYKAQVGIGAKATGGISLPGTAQPKPLIEGLPMSPISEIEAVTGFNPEVGAKETKELASIVQGDTSFQDPKMIESHKANFESWRLWLKELKESKDKLAFLKGEGKSPELIEAQKKSDELLPYMYGEKGGKWLNTIAFSLYSMGVGYQLADALISSGFKVKGVKFNAKQIEDLVKRAYNAYDPETGKISSALSDNDYYAMKQINQFLETTKRSPAARKMWEKIVEQTGGLKLQQQVNIFGSKLYAGLPADEIAKSWIATQQLTKEMIQSLDPVKLSQVTQQLLNTSPALVSGFLKAVEKPETIPQVKEEPLTKVTPPVELKEELKVEPIKPKNITVTDRAIKEVEVRKTIKEINKEGGTLQLRVNPKFSTPTITGDIDRDPFILVGKVSKNAPFGVSIKGNIDFISETIEKYKPKPPPTIEPVPTEAVKAKEPAPKEEVGKVIPKELEPLVEEARKFQEETGYDVKPYSSAQNYKSGAILKDNKIAEIGDDDHSILSNLPEKLTYRFVDDYDLDRIEMGIQNELYFRIPQNFTENQIDIAIKISPKNFNYVAIDILDNQQEVVNSLNKDFLEGNKGQLRQFFNQATQATTGIKAEGKAPPAIEAKPTEQYAKVPATLAEAKELLKVDPKKPLVSKDKLAEQMVAKKVSLADIEAVRGEKIDVTKPKDIIVALRDIKAVKKEVVAEPTPKVAPAIPKELEAVTEKPAVIEAPVAEKATPVPAKAEVKVEPTKPPIPPSPPTTQQMAEEPIGDPIARLNELIKQAKPRRGRLETEYTKERARRIAEVERAIDEIGGEQGYIIALSKLKGKLAPSSKYAFEPIKDKLSKEEIDSLYNKTFKHPYLDEWEKISAANELTNILAGEIPTPKGLVLLEEIYGTDLIKNILSKRALGLKIADVLIDVANIPRAILATADMSGFLRQGIVYVVSHPVIASKAMGKTFQFAFSSKAFEQYFKDLPKDKLYPLMRKSGLAVTDPSRVLATGREEAFISRLMQQIPIIGQIIKFAERSYVGFLNKLRVDVFKTFADEFLSKGYSPVKDKDLFKATAEVVNTFTGRGSLGNLNRITPFLNTIFFSPRLIMARFNALNPIWYVKMPKEIRMKALGDFAKFVVAGLTLLAIIKASGLGDVETDPRSSDFGKIKIGNTRWDVWGGFQQWCRVFSQFITGKRKNTSTGEIISLTKEDYPFTTRKEIVLRFIEGKLAPVPALINELISGAKTFEGEDITFETVAREKFIPMYIQDITEAYMDGGLGRAVGSGITAFFGVGVQTWQERKAKKEDFSIFNKYKKTTKSTAGSVFNKYK